jgi:hypothetical protein
MFRRASPLSKSNGFVLIFVVLAMLGILGIVFITDLATGNRKISRGENTTLALAKAKEALLAYAITRDDPGRPGEFPCPTTVAPTSATYGTSAAGCATVRIGRLPWKTLGIPEIFDSDGEPLWYAVSTNFRPAVAKINSDTLGSLTIYDVGGTSILKSQIVAIVFSAGAPVSNQARTTAVSFCATTATSIAGNICAANYLESSSGRNNATSAGPYIADRVSATFNDQIAYITTADFMPKIEDRIAVILTRTLNDYYVTNSYYPYAAKYADYTFPNGLNCVNSTYSGRLPLYIAASPHSGLPCTGLADWQPVGNPNGLPAWFTGNEWNSAVHYVIGKAFEKGGTKSCVVAGDCLTVGSDNAVQAAFILPGIATPTQSRPSSISTNYLESTAWPPPPYTYVPTTSTLPTRDRVIAIKN